MSKYPYNRFKAIWCYFTSHKWMAYGFEFNSETEGSVNIDKCLCCNKERKR